MTKHYELADGLDSKSNMEDALRIAGRMILEFVNDSAVGGSPITLDKHGQARVENFLNKEAGSSLLDGYFRFKFSNRIDVTLNIDFQWEPGDQVILRDSVSGNIYRKFQNPTVNINWASFGNMGCVEAIGVLKFYNRVAEFGVRLQQKLEGELYELMQTRDQELAMEQDAVRQKLVELVKEETKGLLKGVEKVVHVDDHKLDHKHVTATFEQKKRSFEVSVLDGDRLRLVRTA
jgi:hypothetical protein